MKIVRPSNNPDHVISIAPRDYVEEAVFFVKYKSKEEEYTSQAVTCVENNGRLEVSFKYDFIVMGDYDVYLETPGGALLYRGALYATDVTDLQNYKFKDEE